MNLLHNILRVAKEVEEEIEHVLDPKEEATVAKVTPTASLATSVVAGPTAVTGDTHPVITGE